MTTMVDCKVKATPEDKFCPETIEITMRPGQRLHLTLHDPHTGTDPVKVDFAAAINEEFSKNSIEVACFIFSPERRHKDFADEPIFREVMTPRSDSEERKMRDQMAHNRALVETLNELAKAFPEIEIQTLTVDENGELRLATKN